jgi:hypothetical protein
MSVNYKANGPVTLSEEQIMTLLQKLSTMRHDVSGRMSNVTAAAELIRARPDKMEERLKILLDQPQLAVQCITQFSKDMESMLGVVRQWKRE